MCDVYINGWQLLRDLYIGHGMCGEYIYVNIYGGNNMYMCARNKNATIMSDWF